MYYSHHILHKNFRLIILWGESLVIDAAESTCFECHVLKEFHKTTALPVIAHASSVQIPTHFMKSVSIWFMASWNVANRHSDVCWAVCRNASHLWGYHCQNSEHRGTEQCQTHRWAHQTGQESNELALVQHTAISNVLIQTLGAARSYRVRPSDLLYFFPHSISQLQHITDIMNTGCN